MTGPAHSRPGDPFGLAARPPDVPALLTSEGTVTYGALRDTAHRTAETLLPDAHRRLVMSFAGNGLPFVTFYLAALAVGAVFVPLPDTTPPAARDALLDRYRPEHVLDPAHTDDPGLRRRGYRPAPAEPALWTRSAAGPLAHPGTAAALPTSGSSGAAKLVRLSAANLGANATAIATALGLAPADVAITGLPLHYSYGLSVLNSHLAAGAAVTLTAESPLTPRFWRTAAETGTTSFAGVPAVYQALLTSGGPRYPLGKVSTLTQAGGRAPAPVLAAAHALMRARGGRLFAMYGQTEATARISCLPSELFPAKPGSVGLPVPGGRLAIGDGGEIHYTGPNVMMGYAADRADFTRAPGPALLRTGDLGHLDEDGCLYVTGRRARFVKILGRRLSLDEVERLLAGQVRLPVACVADLRGDQERIIACVARAARPADEAALRVRISQAYGLPIGAVTVRSLPELPLTATGKTDYTLLSRLGDDQ